MITFRDLRWTGICGFAGVIAVLVIPLSHHLPVPFPSWGLSTSDLVEWFRVDSTFYFAQSLASVVSFLGALVFIVGLVAVLRATGRDSVATSVAVISMVTSVAIAFVYAALFMMAAAGASYHPMNGEIVRFAYESALFIWMVSQPVYALTVAAVGIAIRDTGGMPRWTSRLSALVAVITVPATFLVFFNHGALVPGYPVSFVPYALFFIWTGVLGVQMIRTGRQRTDDPNTPVPAHDQVATAENVPGGRP